MAFITILIPLYNGIEFLEECIDSIIAQTFTDWNVLIGINGHGEDGGLIVNTVKKMTEKDSRIQYIIQPPPLQGKVESLNHMVCVTTSDWIALIDCDDKWENNKLERQVEALHHAAKDAAVIGTYARIFGERDDYLTLSAGYINPAELERHNPIVNSSVLIRKEFCTWEYNEYTGNALEDYNLWMHICLLDKKLYNVPEYLTWHRIHSTSAFNSKGHSNDSIRAAYSKRLNKITKI